MISPSMGPLLIIVYHPSTTRWRQGNPFLSCTGEEERNKEKRKFSEVEANIA
jgi:hypothetical protein